MNPKKIWVLMKISSETLRKLVILLDTMKKEGREDPIVLNDALASFLDVQRNYFSNDLK